MIVALFAVDQKGGMGFDNCMPWPRNKEDMQWFKQLTEDNIVVMGKNTWTSADMPTPLPNRLNVLVTNNFIDREDIIQIRGDIPSGLLKVQEQYPEDNLFVIGGPSILMQSIPVLESAYITRIPGEYMNDVNIDLAMFLENFKLVETKELETCNIEKYEAIS